jgi:hypothetical protein
MIKTSHLLLALLVRLVGPAGNAEALDADARRDATATMKVAALADPCAVIRAALGADRKSCSGFRDRHGILRIHATLTVDGHDVELLKPGKVCPGGYLGVRFHPDDSPRKFASFLDVKFGISSEDERLSFGGNEVRWSGCPNCGTMSKGCFDVDGWLVLRQGRWLRPGDLGGCASAEE